MGCDIHLFLEHTRKDTQRESSWRCLMHKVNPGRNYWIFGLMSEGVRTSELPNAFPRKGMPEDASWKVRDANELIIIDPEKSEEWEVDQEGYCSLKSALRWEEGGSKITYRNEKPRTVTHPDWHSHSWLSTEEFKVVIDTYLGLVKSTPFPDVEAPYQAILATMERLEELGETARLVFWFDN